MNRHLPLSLLLLPLVVGAGSAGAPAVLAQDGSPVKAPAAADSIAAFVHLLPTHPGVDRELARFDGGELPADYRREFARVARRRVEDEVVALVDQFQEQGCEAEVGVEFPGKRFTGLPEPTDVMEDFENSVVVTRSTACLRADVTPAELLRIYGSREVRLEAQSRMRDVFEADGLTCYDVGGVPLLLSPTLSCNLVTRMSVAGLAAEHSQTVRSEVQDRQPVYFKESLKAAVELAGGTHGLVHVTITRSTGLSGLEKRLGRGKIEGSLRRQGEVLAEHLAREQKR